MDALRPQLKKPSFPISEGLRAYLRRYRRERALPITYERLRRFSEAAPLVDASGKTTLWESVVYDRLDMESLNEDLKQVYASIRVDGDLSVMRHLYVDRVDFCAFGNSAPFRIRIVNARIVNAFNDNADYYYVKRADASRVYGLELEHLLSPNRLNYLTCGSGAHRGAAGRRLHQPLARQPRAPPDPHRQGAGHRSWSSSTSAASCGCSATCAATISWWW